ncbi:hypothetical protein [Pleionea sediminis]|uniref:hypothetical protein n=1 Tax=Pleionea sediminis TaxID=2569479 RepID=UPI001185CC3E|nr:hypothetical protein [Pleionea sediminis]
MAAKPIRLTQKQWLNIIIISIAFMILLFTLVGQILEKKLTHSTESEAPFKNIEKLQIDNWSAIQINSDCQQSKKLVSVNQCLVILEEWRTYSPMVITNEFDKGKTVLNLEVSIDSQKSSWQLKLHNQQLMLISQEQKLAFILTTEQRKSLFPDELLKNWLDNK